MQIYLQKGEKKGKKKSFQMIEIISPYIAGAGRDQESISLGRKSIIYQGQEKGNIIPLTSSLAKRRKVL